MNRRSFLALAFAPVVAPLVPWRALKPGDRLIPALTRLTEDCNALAEALNRARYESILLAGAR